MSLHGDRRPPAPKLIGAHRTGVLRNRNFLLLWSGNGASLMGTFGARLCYPILTLDISGSPVLAGWTTFAATVPGLLFYAHAGVVADFCDRRRTMLRCQLLGAAASAVLTGWILAGGPALAGVVVGVALVEGAAFAYFGLAEVAAVRDLVPEEQYPAAFSLYEAEQPAAILMGRVGGAALLGAARWAPFAGNLASYALSLGAVSAMRGDFSPVADRRAERREPWWTRMRDGLAWVRRSRYLGASTLATAAANALFQVTILLLIVQSHQDGRPAWSVGVTLAGAGVGGVAGGGARAAGHAGARARVGVRRRAVGLGTGAHADGLHLRPGRHGRLLVRGGGGRDGGQRGQHPGPHRCGTARGAGSGGGAGLARH
ncbi:MFS transporter, partial [Actinacidiphila bryophytorum]